MPSARLAVETDSGEKTKSHDERAIGRALCLEGGDGLV
jgi:hypothetical protein